MRTQRIERKLYKRSGVHIDHPAHGRVKVCYGVCDSPANGQPARETRSRLNKVLAIYGLMDGDYQLMKLSRHRQEEIDKADRGERQRILFEELATRTGL